MTKKVKAPIDIEQLVQEVREHISTPLFESLNISDAVVYKTIESGLLNGCGEFDLIITSSSISSQSIPHQSPIALTGRVTSEIKVVGGTVIGSHAIYTLLGKFYLNVVSGAIQNVALASGNSTLYTVFGYYNSCNQVIDVQEVLLSSTVQGLR
jgi:hypothetical protein